MARRGAKALAGQSNRALEGVRINRSRRLWTVPGTRWEPGTGRRSGSKPPLRVSRALRWAVERSERRWNPLNSKVPALHREA